MNTTTDTKTTGIRPPIFHRVVAMTLVVAATLVLPSTDAAAGGRRETGGEGRTPAPAPQASRLPGESTPDLERGITAARPAPATLPPDFLDQPPPTGAARSFTTDFSRATVDFGDILSGGPPKDGIPSIDAPEFVSMTDAERWISPREAVLALTRGETTHIYPLQILMWHEIVNDTVGGLPVAVTWCPLCNTAVAFDRRAPGFADAPASTGASTSTDAPTSTGTSGSTDVPDNNDRENRREVLDFGVTGRLRFSNLIMYDRTTESWWQQADGEGIAGAYAGARLAMVPVLMLSFEEALQVYPEARVLSRDTGHRRSYGANPYRGYEDSREPFLYRGPAVDTTYRSLERVLVYIDGEDSHAVAYSVLRRGRVIPVSVEGEAAYLLWAPGVAGALSAESVGAGPDVGTANAVLARTRGGQAVELYRDGEAIRDRGTGSRWSAAGHALDGPLAGERLEPAPTVQHFWFSASAFGAILMEEPGFR